MKDTLSKIEGCLFGMAYGDAMAAPAEFIRTPWEIEARCGERASIDLTSHGKVTDDTQMALAVGEALVACGSPYTVARFEPHLREHFVAWLVSPDNTRAPGVTCMTACRALADGRHWLSATRLDSKGCGANMRVQPVGLLFDQTPEKRAELAQFQAAITHGHPTALAASDLTAWAIHDLALGGEITTLVERLIAYAKAQKTVCHHEWLPLHCDRTGHESQTHFMGIGWDECLGVLEKLSNAVALDDRASNRERDPCLFTGDAWIAEEAFATGLLCFLWFPDDPVAALQRATVTRGDSDSIACLTGAFAGAYHGMGAWPDAWRGRIEYSQRLTQLSRKLLKKQTSV
jgi:ADP-ribosylglycohydrolase